MSNRPSRRVALLLLAGSIVFGACGGGSEATPVPLKTIPRTVLPDEVLGLKVASEESETLVEGVSNSYVDAVGLFSFRREDLLQATLQVTHFSESANHTDADFQERVVSQILQAGADVPHHRMRDRKVYLGAGSRQSVAVWFDDQYMMVLSAREDFEQPRALLRALMELGVGE